VAARARRMPVTGSDGIENISSLLPCSLGVLSGAGDGVGHRRDRRPGHGRCRISESRTASEY